MSIFSKDGSRLTWGYTEESAYRLIQNEFFQEPYAWSWSVAKAFVEAFRIKFSVQKVLIEARYEKERLGTCRTIGDDRYKIFLRPSMRGHEAWRTLGHELAHTITPASEPMHGEAFCRKLIIVHDFWKEFLASTEGDLKDLVIRMVLDYGPKKGRPIGLDENTGPRGFPWIQR